MSEFAKFLVCFRPPICVSEGFHEGVHEVVPKGFINFKGPAANFVIKVG